MLSHCYGITSCATSCTTSCTTSSTSSSTSPTPSSTSPTPSSTSSTSSPSSTSSTLLPTSLSLSFNALSRFFLIFFPFFPPTVPEQLHHHYKHIVTNPIEPGTIYANLRFFPYLLLSRASRRTQTTLATLLQCCSTNSHTPSTLIHSPSLLREFPCSHKPSSPLRVLFWHFAIGHSRSLGTCSSSSSSSSTGAPLAKLKSRASTLDADNGALSGPKRVKRVLSSVFALFSTPEPRSLFFFSQTFLFLAQRPDCRP
ncbi:LANO_0A02960g1_1 [Lachancea nothofagi CBS 11611]|uniref:LANO_0A02960g1_1 n=1 Tax=Lachancea nothofagi CBS 11611 TaxID=1266666 RepID=A0A1G4IP43_9SACH|nr:LANO_0A02960g1_1 [Lachancea nothofagi CBS 11611]